MKGHAAAEARHAVSPAPTFLSGLPLLAYAAKLQGIEYGG